MSLAQISNVFHRKAHLIYGLIVIVLISGLSVFVSQTLLTEPQEIRKDASTNDLAGYITDLPVHVDPQTGEFYDLQINIYPFKLIKNTSSGPLYFSDLTFKIIGDRVRGISSLYGFIQKTGSTNEHSGNFAFSYNNSPGTPEFTADSVKLDDANDSCIDLFSTQDAQQNSYVATYCLSLDIVQPGTDTNRRLYSPSSNPWLEFTYTGTTDVGVISMSSSFNKFKLNTSAKLNGDNQHGNRVTYFTLTDGAKLTDFKDLTYHLTPITSQLSEAEYDQWCQVRDDLDKKYFRYGFSLTHAGGNMTQLTPENKTGACEYSIQQNSFVPGWMSLQKSHGYLPIVANPPYTEDQTPSEPTAKSDLLIESISLDKNSVAGGENITAKVKVKNVGTISADNFRVAVWSGLIDDATNLDTFLGSDRRNSIVDTLSPGQSIERDVVIDDIFVNRTTKDRKFGMYAIADIDEAIEESDENNNRSSTQTLTSLTTPPTNNRVSWSTDDAMLEADNFFIVAQDQYYVGEAGNTMTISSDPTSGPEDTYTSLEMIWRELGTEMRYFLYFNRDNQEWWTKEMRTFDKDIQNDWIMYVKSEPFASAALGSEFSKPGETVFTSSDGRGSLHFTNLRMQAFLKPTASAQPTAQPTTDPNVTQIPGACPFSTDFDGNGRTEIDDYVIFISHLMQAGTTREGDVNCDNQVDISDYPYISRNMSPLN